MTRCGLRAVGTVLFLSVAMSSPAFAGGKKCLVIDSIWEGGHSEAETELSQAIEDMATTMNEESLITNEELMSAIRVHVRQRAVGGEQSAVARSKNAEAAAQVYVEQKSAERVREAHETYGPQGQMVGGCGMIERLKFADLSMQSRTARATEVLSSDAIDAVPGSAVGVLEAAASRLTNDRPEAVSAVSFFEPDTSSADRDAFMNNVIGLPFVRPEGIDGIEDDLLFMQTRRWEALRSPALTQLAIVRAAAEKGGLYDSDEDASDTESFLGAVDYYIAQFGGGDLYEQWSASLVTKSDAGLSKEIARLRAISLQLSKYRQESADRQLAVLASLLAGMAVQ